MGVALGLIATDPDISAKHFGDIVKAAHADIRDVSFTYEGETTRFSATLVAILAIPSRAGADEADPKSASVEPSPHCGATALALLLQIEGFRVAPSFFESKWSLSDQGSSMRELQQVASTRGLKLTGVLLRRSEDAVDRPMIVFLKYGRHGHYAVLRPGGIRASSSSYSIRTFRPEFSTRRNCGAPPSGPGWRSCRDGPTGLHGLAGAYSRAPLPQACRALSLRADGARHTCHRSRGLTPRKRTSKPASIAALAFALP
ncbi:MAG: cysteine peptidase family C39 domain-containing protein [Isosphaeraceae bacterium]